MCYQTPSIFPRHLSSRASSKKILPLSIEDLNREISQIELLPTSYIFSSPENVSQQGQVVPVGYGRVKVGSTIISVSSSNVDRQIWEDNDMDVLGGLKSVFTRSPDVKPGGGGGGGSSRTNYHQK